MTVNFRGSVGGASPELREHITDILGAGLDDLASDASAPGYVRIVCDATGEGDPAALQDLATRLGAAGRAIMDAQRAAWLDLRTSRMRITFDTAARAAYVRVREGTSDHQEVDGDGLIVDVSASGETLGYEILSVRAREDVAGFQHLPSGPTALLLALTSSLGRDGAPQEREGG